MAPVPEAPRVGVAGDAAEQTGVVRVRHLVVADDVAAVERNAPPVREVGDELRRGAVLALGVCAPAHPSLVFYPDRVQVPPVVARVPRDIGDRHELNDLATA